MVIEEPSRRQYTAEMARPSMLLFTNYRIVYNMITILKIEKKKGEETYYELSICFCIGFRYPPGAPTVKVLVAA